MDERQDIDEVVYVTILLKSISNAPQLLKQKHKLDSSKTVYEVEKYLKKALGVQSVFLYIGSGFSPTPDQTLKELSDCFRTNAGELIINYGLQESYG